MNLKDKAFKFFCVLFLVYWFFLFFNWIIPSLTYLYQIASFPFDWGPSDGDHFNFAVRILNGDPIFLSFDKGYVLNIYNPLYHYVVAFSNLILGPSMAVARSISILVFLLVPIIGFFFYKKNNSLVLSFLFAGLMLVPNVDGYLLELTTVGPHGLMPFMFFITLALLDFSDQVENKKLALSLVGLLCTLTFFAKQQGLIAFGSCLLYLLYRKTSFKNIVVFLAASGLPAICIIAYLEYKNNGNYLTSCFFDLQKIIRITPGLAKERLTEFMLMNLSCLMIACLSTIFYIKKGLKLSVWHISMFLHFPFLLKILGNAGGGPSYFATLWFCLLSIAIVSISNLLSNKRYYFYSIALAAIITNSIFSYKLSSSNLTSAGLPNKELIEQSLNYSKKLKILIAENPGKPILTNRNIGIIIQNGGLVLEEGSTQFQYLWASGDLFSRDFVLNDIRNRNFSLITTGLQKYPDDVQKEIDNYYRPELIAPINLIFNNTGLVTVYKPKY